MGRTQFTEPSFTQAGRRARRLLDKVRAPILNPFLIESSNKKPKVFMKFAGYLRLIK